MNKKVYRYTFSTNYSKHIKNEDFNCIYYLIILLQNHLIISIIL